MNWKSAWVMLATLMVISIVSQPAQSQTPDLNVTINSIPKNAEEFGNLRDQIANTPQGGIVMLVLAL
ncbi:MAG: hypothetical protein KDK27_09155, partial [Leptospiraceae bacterium]|nr:hypothetical protein [Leptospiraceae bacterium]